MNPPEHSFNVGERPAIRGADRSVRGYVDGYRCPFCGSEALKISDNDVAADTERIELYCDNKPDCDVKEIVVLAAAGAGRLHRRADVTALRAVDEGTRAEQESDGYEFTTLDDGTTSRAMGFTTGWKNKSQGERDRDKVERRKRLTAVDVHPVPDDDQ